MASSTSVETTSAPTTMETATSAKTCCTAMGEATSHRGRNDAAATDVRSGADRWGARNVRHCGWRTSEGTRS